MTLDELINQLQTIRDRDNNKELDVYNERTELHELLEEIVVGWSDRIFIGFN